MKPARFEYARPATLAGAAELLAASDGDGKLIAGGQSLVPMLNMRLAQPAMLVDLALAQELQQVRRDGDVLVLGACVRQRVAERSAEVSEACPLVAQALRHVGHVQIRNRGTIGGSIAHADPTAELPAVALALDAELVVTSVRGPRRIAAKDFFAGPYTTRLEEDEVLTEIRLPVLEGARTSFHEVARRNGDFALAGVAAVVRYDSGSATVAEARLAAVGATGAPVRLAHAEAGLAGRELNEDAIRTSEQVAREELEGGSSMATAPYRRHLVGSLLGRALAEVRA